MTETTNKSIFGPRRLIDRRKLIEDDVALQPSFGLHVPDTTDFPAGGICNIGWLAGTANVDPKRAIAMDDCSTQDRSGKERR